MGKRRYRRQEQSLKIRLQEHLAKVAAERTKETPNEELIRHWEREIEAFTAGIARARKKQRNKQ